MFEAAAAAGAGLVQGSHVVPHLTLAEVSIPTALPISVGPAPCIYFAAVGITLQHVSLLSTLGIAAQPAREEVDERSPAGT